MIRFVCTTCKKMKRARSQPRDSKCRRHLGREAMSRLRVHKTFKKVVNESVSTKSSKKRR